MSQPDDQQLPIFELSLIQNKEEVTVSRGSKGAVDGALDLFAKLHNMSIVPGDCGYSIYPLSGAWPDVTREEAIESGTLSDLLPGHKRPLPDEVANS